MNCSKNLAITINPAPIECAMSDIVWAAPYVFNDAESSGAGNLAYARAYCDGTNPFMSETIIVGTFNYTGPETTLALLWNIYAIVGDSVTCAVAINSSVDGDLLLVGYTEVTGSVGLTKHAFTIPASAGAVITVTISALVGNIDNPGETGSFEADYDFCGPACIDWNTLAWNAAATFNGSFSPSSTTGATFVSITNGGVGVASNTGLITYDGAECDCKCTITVAGDALPNNGTCKFSFAKVAPYTPYSCFAAAGAAVGNYVATFTLPDTGGVPTVFAVTISFQSDPGSLPTTFTGVLSID